MRTSKETVGPRRARCASPLLAAAVMGVCVSACLAATDTEVGTTGADGANGQVINNGGLLEVTDGQPGGGGGTAGAVADSVDATNTATATGGNGGKGGSGISAGAISSKGAAGGNGGGASANASQTAASSATVVTDTATATGGNGGNGGNGGSQRFGPTAAGGNGGKGGIAIATASANSNCASILSYVQAYVEAIGGNGGNGGTAGGNGGDGGIASIGNAASASSGMAAPKATAIVIGGNGGAGGSGGTGGNGASESLNNALQLTYPGHLTGTSGSQLLQEAIGGDGGGGNFGTAGLSGSGSSTINYTLSNAPSLIASGYGYGGDGAACQGANGAAGGTAYASTTLHSDYSQLLYAETDTSSGIAGGVVPAQRGKGSDVISGTGNGGNGGAGTAYVAGYSTGADGHAQIEAEADADAGNGGSVLNTASGSGGAGGNATAGAIGSNATSDGVFLTANAQAGAGGQGQGAGNAGGAGGTASLTSTAVIQATSASGTVGITAQATGGAGGSGLSGAAAGRGGDANVLNPIIASTSGQLTIEQVALGGDAGGSIGGGASSSGGNATSTYNRSFNVAPSSLTIDASALAGGAADSQSADGSSGGTANASLVLSTPGGVTATVGANYYAPNTSGGYGIGGNVTAGSGSGGAGSAATASGAVSSTGGGSVSLSVEAIGGTGGQGMGSGFAGGAGGSAMINPSTAGSAGADATLNVTAIGGDGGAGVGGAAGGNGASITLSNVVGGSAGTYLLLRQVAIGGAGGSSDGGGAGTGGVATSQINLNASGQPDISAQAQAGGGKGGDSQSANAAPGADSHASMILSSDRAVSGGASSSSGGGGNITGGLAGFAGGDAGTAYADSSVTGTGTTSGQSAASAGATAEGGSGGSIPSGLIGSGGRGGDVNANATASGVGPDMVQASASAFAGAGGVGSGNGFASGNGGNATGTAIATNSAGPATAGVTAAGGFSLAPLSNASPGAVGSVNVSSTAIGVNQAIASTTANQAISGPSTSLAKANATGLFSFLQSTTSAPADQTGNSYSIAAVNQAAPGFPISFAHATGALAGTPPPSDVTARWTPDSNVKTSFASDPSRVQAIAISDLNYPTGGSGAAHTYSSAMELNLNNAQLTTNGMVLGLLAAQLDGGGQGLAAGDSLRFRVVRNNATLIDQTFTSNPQLLSYFQNTVLALGPQNAGLNGDNLDLKLLFDFTGTHPGAGAGMQMLMGTAPMGTGLGGVWNNAAGGSWGIPSNWSANTMPTGPGTSATFGSIITSPQTVTLDENTTVGSINFDNSSPYSIIPDEVGYSLNLDNAAAPAQINVISGSHAIDAPINIAGPGVIISVPAVQNLGVGGISGPGDVIKTGNGSVVVGPMSVNGLSVQAGRMQFGSSSSAPARSVGPLSISPGAILDISDGKLVTTSPAGTWNGSSYTGVTGLVESGRAGASGILSSAIAAGDRLHAIGVAKVGDIKQIGDTDTILLAGQLVHGSDTLVMYTYGGDANLDGKINIDDYGRIDGNVGQSGSVFGWYNGDFNYDGKINIDDYGIIDGNIGQQGAPIATISADGLSAGVTAVPEPTSLAVLMAGGLWIRWRRGGGGGKAKMQDGR